MAVLVLACQKAIGLKVVDRDLPPFAAIAEAAVS